MHPQAMSKLSVVHVAIITGSWSLATCFFLITVTFGAKVETENNR